MKLKLIAIILLVLMILIVLTFFVPIHQNSIEDRNLVIEDRDLVVGRAIQTDIQTPHPYPAGESGRTVVWSYMLNYTNSPGLRLHFREYSIKGYFSSPVNFVTKDYGPCNLSSREVNGIIYERRMIDPNTIAETSKLPERTDNNSMSLGSLQMIKCGIVDETQKFTNQEMFDNNYTTGDFLLITDKDGKVLDIITGHRTGIWSPTYFTDSLNMTLYSDTGGAYGLYIDEYTYLFPRT